MFFFVDFYIYDCGSIIFTKHHMFFGCEISNMVRGEVSRQNNKEGWNIKRSNK